MDLETRRFGFSDFFNTVPKCIFSSDLETKFVIKSLIQDDKIQLVNISKRLLVSNSLDRADYQTAVTSKLLRLCCMLDSVNCATSLINGELGPVAVVNQVDKSFGMSALHLAAEFHLVRCVELLLKKRARTDEKSKDGRGLLPLELSLSISSSRMTVCWNPDEYCVEDLIVMLGEKDLTTVKVLCEKTKELDEVAYANAVGGRIVALAALLVVAADKVNESILVLHDSHFGTKEKTTIYECVIREALALGRTTATSTTTLRAAKRNCSPTTTESVEKRKVLLCEIELLQLFGAVVHGSCTDKKVGTPLILAAQAGDEAVIEILLKSNLDVNDVDVEGNSALHWALRTSSMGLSQHEQQNRIVSLLLKHGAEVSQKNKLGLTALHIAAGSGNTQALEVLIREDPDCINFRTIMKETPLFFAVKNDHMVCAELLLSWGANSEVLNLRERPRDWAKTQDMRVLLKAANICHKNLAVLTQDKYKVEGDNVILETCEALLSMMDEDTNTERIWSSPKIEVCKYFESPTGSARGSKCFYTHDEEELQKTKQEKHLIRSSKEEFKRKIFVGGLPLSLDSDSLAEFFEEHFGSVEDAIVVGVQIEKQIQTGGFGFVTFKHEKSVSTAIQARFVSIMSKQVEIKSALPKDLLLAEFQKQSAQLQKSEHIHSHLQAKSQGEETTEKMTSRKVTVEIPTKKIAEELPCRKITEEAKTEEMSWAGKLLHGQPKTCSNDSQPQAMSSFEEKSIPKWLRTFKKWLPRFLKDVYRSPIEGEYALSSLKSDFKAAFGQELDHVSLGYPKLSDFIKTLPNLCHIKTGTICKNGSPNHMVILPSTPRRKGRVHQSFTTQRLFSPSNSINDSNDCIFNDSKSPQEIQPESIEYAGFISIANEGEPSHDVPVQRDTSNSVDSAPENTPIIEYSRFVQFLKPGSFSYNGNTGGSGGNNNGGGGLEKSEAQNLRPLPRHLVLESLARRRNNRSEYFLREFDFYDDYKARLAQVKCFGCNQRPMNWENIPCRHLLWCNDCRLEAVKAAEGFDHKCVICDMKVEDIKFLPSNRDNQQPLPDNLSNTEAFPPSSNIEASPSSSSTEAVPPLSDAEAVPPLSCTKAFPSLCSEVFRSTRKRNRR